MTAKARLDVIVASYVSRADAKSDLEAFDTLYFNAAVGAYDAALVINSAWGNAQLGARTSRSSADFLDGPLHDAFTTLFGGPFMGGTVSAPISDIDRRLPQETVVRLGDSFAAASVVLIIVALVHDSEALASAFSRAQWVTSDNVAWTDENMSRLPVILRDVLNRGARPKHEPGAAKPPTGEADPGQDGITSTLA